MLYCCTAQQLSAWRPVAEDNTAPLTVTRMCNTSQLGMLCTIGLWLRCSHLLVTEHLVVSLRRNDTAICSICR